MVTTVPRQDVPPTPPGRTRWLIVALAVALAGALTAVGLLASRDTGTPARSTAAAPAPSTSAPQPPAPSASAPRLPSATQPQPPSATVAPPFLLGYQPLYPFASRADALAWMRSYHSGGHQPWHLDAAATARAFTTGFLGFTGIDQVTSSVGGSRGAYIGVGHHEPDGDGHTAAVLHLVRFGPEADAPWEVVGTDDTTFSIDTPAYGERVSSPVIVGGHVTGVDESIRVAVRQLSSERPLGQSAAVPAGGHHHPWLASVRFAGASDPTLTIVASTGGHRHDVERFAVQGVEAA